MPKFYVIMAGTLPVTWGLEVEAATVDIAEQEALDSVPRYEPVNWKMGTEVINISVGEVETLPDEPKDIDMGRRELEEKYSSEGSWGRGHHPELTRRLWRGQVAKQGTVLGYWDWVYEQLRTEDEPDEAQ